MKRSGRDKEVNGASERRDLFLFQLGPSMKEHF